MQHPPVNHPGLSSFHRLICSWQRRGKSARGVIVTPVIAHFTHPSLHIAPSIKKNSLPSFSRLHTYTHVYLMSPSLPLSASLSGRLSVRWPDGASSDVLMQCMSEFLVTQTMRRGLEVECVYVHVLTGFFHCVWGVSVWVDSCGSFLYPVSALD